MWLLPALLILAAIACSIPLSIYFTWLMEGRYRAPRVLKWFEDLIDTGPQDWKQYTIALVVFNIALFIFGFVVLCLQPYAPLNPRGLGWLAPTTIFNTVISFMTNADLQHYRRPGCRISVRSSSSCRTCSCRRRSVSAPWRRSSAFSARGEVRQFLHRYVARLHVHLRARRLVFGIIFMPQGMPMTYASTEVATTLEQGSMGLDDKGQAKPQTIVVGPVAAVIPIKMLGTNGGGFYGMNASHPLENPTATTNFFTTLAMMLFPFALVLMYGRMLGRIRHSVVIYGVMLAMMIGLIAWVIRTDTMEPNPGLTAHAGTTYQVASASAPNGKLDVPSPAVAALPVDQHLGNLEGKELRFGTSAGAAFAAITTDVTCGAINGEMDSLNPLAGLSPMIGMWLNCVFGGKGVGMINLLLFLIVGVFLAGLMVGRTPEYLGKKVGAREMKLAMIALLVHPILILGPSGLFAATGWGTTAEANPGAHGFSEIVYQYSSASANNGSAMDGLGVTYGLNDNASPSPEAAPWDIGTGLVMLFSRYLPIIAPIAMAFSLGRKKAAPVTLGTMSDDTLTFGFLLFGTILIVGALLFLPVAALGPLAEHLGPIPFGG